MSYTSEYYNALEKLKKRKNTDTDDLKGLDDYSAEYYRSLREAQSRQSTSKDSSFEDDIAPVSKGGDKDSWFKLGGFSDGVDSVGDFFGDLGETILGTSADLGLGVLKGAGRLVEGIADLGTYAVAGAADLFGADEFADKTRKVAQYSAVDEWTKGATDYVDQYSVLGNKADMISEGIGQVGGIILTGGLGSAAGLGTLGTTILTTGVTGLSGMGSGMNEAYELGATDEEAAKYGATVGAIEAASELIFAGLGKGVKALGLSKGLTSIDDIAARKLSNAAAKYITSEAGQKVVGNTLEYAVKSGAEGLEEVISGFGSAIAKDVYLYNDENEKPFSEILADENLLEQFVVGSITSGIAQSGIVPGMKSGSLIEANKTGRDFITGNTASDQAVIDKVVENRVAEAEKDGKKLSKKEIGKIEEQVQDALEKGQLDIDTIESVLGGETYTAYKDNLAETEKLKQEYEELSNIKRSDLTRAQEKRIEELEAMNLNDTTKSDGLRQQLDDKLKPLLKDSKLTETYNERARRGQVFEADLTKYKGKQREAVERAINSGVLNNTYRSHELVNVLSKIEADKGVIFDYTNNAKLKESGFAIDGKTVNGFVKDGNVTLNVQSSKAWQSTVGHEITHVLEGTESYSALQSALFKYAESKGEYQSRYDSLAELYNGVKGYETDFDAKVKKELAADLVGDYLFTDKAFINHLTSDRNLFQKIYDEIKYLWNVATGKEKADIEKVKAAFDEAWKQMSVKKETNATNEVAVSTEGMTEADISEGTEYSDNDVRYSISDSDGNTLTAEQSEYFKDSKVRDENGNLKVMYHGSPNADFTVFKSGTYFTEHKWYADVYQGQGASSLGYKKTANNPDTYAVYLDVKKPFDTRNKAERDIFYNEYYRQWGTGTDLQESGLPDWLDGQDLQEFLEENGYDYDGLILDEGGVGGYGDKVKSRGISYVTFSPEQVKNIDNKNPTSDPDIRFSISEETDAEYMLAVENGDMETAQRLVNEAAEKSGYTTNDGYRGSHYAPVAQIDKEYFTDLDKLQELCDESYDLNLYAIANGISLQPDDYFSPNGARWYMYNDADGMESYRAIKPAMDSIQRQMEQYGEVREMPTVKVYRAVPKTLKETKLQSGGQWVTPSYMYAVKHGNNALNGKYKIIEETVSAENLWWDANDIREWGFDDGTNYAYRDTKNNRKLLDAVTYDDAGNVIPLSKRFNYRNADERYSLSNEGEQFAPTGNYSTPAYETALEDIAPVRESAPKAETVAETAPANVQTNEQGDPIRNAIRDIYAKNGWGDMNSPTRVEAGNNEYDADIDAIADGILTQWDTEGSIEGNALHTLLDENAEYDEYDALSNDAHLHDIIKKNLQEYVPAFRVEAGAKASNLPRWAENQIANYADAITEEMAKPKGKSKPSNGDLKRYVSKKPVKDARGRVQEAWQGAMIVDGKQYLSNNGYFIVELNTPDESIPNNGKLAVSAIQNAFNNADKNAIDGTYNIDPRELSLIYKEVPKGADRKNIVVVDDALFDIRYVNAVLKAVENPTISLSALNSKYKMLVVKGDNGKAVIMALTYHNLDSDRTSYVYRAEKLGGYAETIAPEIAETPMTDNAPVQEDIAPVLENIPVLPDDQLAEGTSEAIKPKREKQPSLKKIDSADSEPHIAQVLVEEPNVEKKKRSVLSKAISNFVDKGAAVENLSLKTKNRALQDKYKAIERSETKAQYFMEHGKGDVKSLDAIRAEIEATGKVKDFYNYVYHKHNIGRMSLESKELPNLQRLEGEMRGLKLLNLQENQLRAIASEKITKDTPQKRSDLVKTVREYLASKDVKNKPVFGYEVSAEMSQGIANEYEAKNPQFKEIAQDVYDYMNYLRDMMVENGIISQETADLWAEMYPYFVPIRRDGHDGASIDVPLDTNKTGINAPIKRATGGNSDILPLLDTMALRTLQTFKAIDKNRFGVELKNTLGGVTESTQVNLDEAIDSIDTQDSLLQEGKNGKNPTFTVFEGGERVTFEITDELFDAMKPTSESLSYTNKVLNKASNLHRGVLTEYSVPFMVSNAIKDAQDVLINSQHPAQTYANIPAAINELRKKGKWYTEYMENGGGDNTYFDKQTKTFTEEQSKLRKIVGFPLDKISEANNFIERVPRLAEYIASRKKGATIEAAMLDSARVTTDFSAGGDVTKFLNRNGATFLNASVQGIAQTVRNVREAKMNGLKGWLGLASKAALAGIPAMLLNGLLWDDDEEYEELSDYVKENYYIVGKYGDGKFVRIPKGRALAVIQNGFEQIGNTLTGNDEADFGRFFELFMSNLAPNNPLDNNIIAPIKQVIDNKTWYGEDLVPSRLQDLPAAEQYDESTDAISKWLGEKTNTSPYKINYLLNQYGGGVSDIILPMLTPEAESGDDSLLGNAIAPLKDKFTTDSVMNNQNVSDFYETVDTLTTNAKSSYATDDDILKSKYMNAVNTELSDLYKAKREIQNSNLSDSVKYAQVRNIQKQINELAENALNSYESVNVQGGYATVGDKHYRIDDGTWTKITDEQLEKQNKVTSGLGISPSEYWNNTEEYKFAYDYPEKYALSKSLGGYSAYKAYSKALNDITADKDSNGKSITGSRKEKVLQYINNLDADYETKIILYKSEYPSDDTYNSEIINYLNNREDLTYDDRVSILTALGFRVVNGQIYAD